MKQKDHPQEAQINQEEAIGAMKKITNKRQHQERSFQGIWY